MRVVAPVRVAHTYTQNLKGPAEAVFALLCPVREADWIEGWDPGLVVTGSGIAELDCIFTTGSGEDAAIWMVTKYERASLQIEFVKVTPGVTVGKIAITVRPVGEQASQADITYQHTALSAAGEAFVAGYTEAVYAAFMRGWEARLNHYLVSGTALPNAAAEQAARTSA